MIKAVLSCLLISVAVVACDRPSVAPPILPANVASPAQAGPYAPHYQVLYSFKGTPDGQNPQAGLIVYHGKLYGTTFGGGRHGVGSVFEISPSGKERLLYSFKGGRDGVNPYAGLVAVGGALYGETTAGGYERCAVVGYAYGCGTVFGVTPDGRERVVYSFKGGADGSTPQVTLLYKNGLLYGTTYFGGGSGCYGAEGCGTVFTVSTSGKEHLLHAFQGERDGAYPLGGLSELNGTFYAATFQGGLRDKGTIYQVSAGGDESVLHQFSGRADGGYPWANLTRVGSTFYGTAMLGGGKAKCYHNLGCGTIFAFTPAGGNLKILYNFGDGEQGGNPLAGLTPVGALLYGVAANGGRTGCSGSTFGCGVIFAISRTGRYKVIHYFTGAPSDGATAQGNLVELNGSFYGTTLIGGTQNHGTIFKMTP